MWIDKSLVLCDKVDFFGSAGNSEIGDVLDMTTREDLRGAGMPLYLVLLITTAMTAGTSIDFQLRSADATTGTDPDLNTNERTILTTGAIVLANLTVRSKWHCMLPYGDWVEYRRYMQMRVTRVGASTAGKFSAFLTLEPPQWEPLKAAPNPMDYVGDRLCVSNLLKGSSLRHSTCSILECVKCRMSGRTYCRKTLWR